MSGIHNVAGVMRIGYYDDSQWGLTYYDDQRNEHATSRDSSTVTFDLEPTDECWKKIGGGLTCGATPDSKSETGLCELHHGEIKERYDSGEKKPQVSRF